MEKWVISLITISNYNNCSYKILNKTINITFLHLTSSVYLFNSIKIQYDFPKSKITLQKKVYWEEPLLQIRYLWQIPYFLTFHFGNDKNPKKIKIIIWTHHRHLGHHHHHRSSFTDVSAIDTQLSHCKVSILLFFFLAPLP